MNRLYQINARRLIQNYMESGLAFPDWLARESPRWTKQTWRTYRLALQNYYREIDDPVMLAEVRNARPALKQRIIEPGRTGSDKSLAIQANNHVSRAKYVTEAQLEAIKNALLAGYGVWAKRTWQLFESCLMTGLRPMEWADATYNPGTRILTVNNLKRTIENNPFHAVTRQLRLDETVGKLAFGLLLERENYFAELVDPDNPRQIDAEIAWNEYRQRCSQTFSRAIRLIVKSHQKLFRPDVIPTLYSARHQFAADAKSAGIDELELARMLGHSDLSKVARHYYGRAARGRGSLHVTLVRDRENGK